jgi:hypothetical protein
MRSFLIEIFFLLGGSSSGNNWKTAVPYIGQVKGIFPAFQEWGEVLSGREA